MKRALIYLVFGAAFWAFSWWAAGGQKASSFFQTVAVLMWAMLMIFFHFAYLLVRFIRRSIIDSRERERAHALQMQEEERQRQIKQQKETERLRAGHHRLMAEHKRRVAEQIAEEQRRNQAWNEWVEKSHWLRYAGFALTQNDGSRYWQNHSGYYAQACDVRAALGGIYNADSMEPVDRIGWHYNKLMLEWGDYSTAISKLTYDRLVPSMCPDGYLYVGGGFYWNGQGHMISIGATRSGKGACLILPALLNPLLQIDSPATPSFVVLDPKGENLAIAGRYLRDIAGYELIVINPFNIREILEFQSTSFNVFELFDAADEEFEDFCDMIAFSLIPQTSGEQSFWDDSARDTIILYIQHMMTQNAEPRNFTTLWEWLRLRPGVSKNDPTPPRKKGQKARSRFEILEDMILNSAFDGVVSRDAEALMGLLLLPDTRQIESIFKVVHTHTAIFRSVRMRRAITENGFDAKKIAKTKTAVFVCMAPEKLERVSPMVRIIMGSIIQSLHVNYSTTRKVIMPMDEFIQIGRFKEAERLSNYSAGIGAGITLWPIVQSLSALKKVYPDSWEDFMNNSVITHYVKLNDNFTIDYVLKRMPQTERVESLMKQPQKPEEPIDEYYDDGRELIWDDAHKEESGKISWQRYLREQHEIRMKTWVQLQMMWYNKAQIKHEPIMNFYEIKTCPHIIVEISGCNKIALFSKAPYYLNPSLGAEFADPNPFRAN